MLLSMMPAGGLYFFKGEEYFWPCKCYVMLPNMKCILIPSLNPGVSSLCLYK